MEKSRSIKTISSTWTIWEIILGSSWVHLDIVVGETITRNILEYQLAHCEYMIEQVLLVYLNFHLAHLEYIIDAQKL